MSKSTALIIAVAVLVTWVVMREFGLIYISKPNTYIIGGVALVCFITLFIRYLIMGNIKSAVLYIWIAVVGYMLWWLISTYGLSSVSITIIGALLVLTFLILVHAMKSDLQRAGPTKDAARKIISALKESDSCSMNFAQIKQTIRLHGQSEGETAHSMNVVLRSMAKDKIIRVDNDSQTVWLLKR